MAFSLNLPNSILSDPTQLLLEKLDRLEGFFIPDSFFAGDTPEVAQRKRKALHDSYRSAMWQGSSMVTTSIQMTLATATATVFLTLGPLAGLIMTGLSVMLPLWQLVSSVKSSMNFALHNVNNSLTNAELSVNPVQESLGEVREVLVEMRDLLRGLVIEEASPVQGLTALNKTKEQRVEPDTDTDMPQWVSRITSPLSSESVAWGVWVGLY